MIHSTLSHHLLNAYPDLSQLWDDDVIPTLQEFIKIPNQSPLFDSEWETHGHMQAATQLIYDWCQKQPIQNKQIKLLQNRGRTPLLFIDIAGELSGPPVLIYGHLDKQPPMKGWSPDLGPWQPVLKDGRLYGRGAADDGYSVFSALTAIALLQKLNIPHARCIVLIEGSEESGSIDLPHYLEHLYSEFTAPNFVLGLDSGCINYDQLWGTTSLRGIINGILEIKTLNQGIHSGFGGGVAPSAFNILRLLLDRIEDPISGQIKLFELNALVPPQQLEHAEIVAKSCGLESLHRALPLSHHTQPLTNDPIDHLLRQSWHPALTITGIDGLPATHRAGNVIIPSLAVKLSFRLPPNVDAQKAANALQLALEKDPPYHSTVRFLPREVNTGWLSSPLEPWLATANEQASQLFFQKPAMYIGEGGTIPFMGMLGEKFPNAQFLITGVLGPHSNAHGPDEFLHIDMAKKLTACIAFVIAAHGQHGISS